MKSPQTIPINPPKEEDVNPFLDQKDTKNKDTIVIQIGSHSIKFGLASQYQPFIIPNVIAHKINPDKTSNINIELDNLTFNDDFIQCVNDIENNIVQKENKNKMAKKLAVLNINKSMENQGQNQIKEIPERNKEYTPNIICPYKKMEQMAYDLNEDIVDNNFKWTSLESNPDILIGREALCIPSNNNDYEIRFPIKYGYFNNEFNFYVVLYDLSLILKYCFENVLRINQNEFCNYNIVYIIPDLFIKTEIKAMINLFFKFFGFKNIFLHLESVMSSFGLAIQSSCVVDIGSDKLNICCVDEGMIIKNTLIRKNMGGNEITKLLFLITKYLVKNNNKEIANNDNNNLNNKFPIDLFNINDFRDFRVFEKLKENECEFPPILDTGLGINQLTQKKVKLYQHRKGFPTKIINSILIEEVYLSPLCLFFPKIIETFRPKNIPKINFFNDLTNEKFIDSEDVLAELAKIISISEKKEDNNNNSNNNINNASNTNLNNIKSPVEQSIGSSSPKKSNKEDDDSLMGSPSKSDSNKSFSDEDEEKNKEKDNIVNYENIWDINLGIDDLICQSLMKVKNKELRKKLANSIMLVGGTAKLKGFIDFLEDKLINKLSEMDNEIERVEIFNYPDIDMKTLSWIGGSILPKLESAKDMWIQKERWLGEPEKMDEQIDNNIDINKKEINANNDNNNINNDKKKENEIKNNNENNVNNNMNNNIEVGSQSEKSKNEENEKNNEMVIEKEEKEEKDEKEGKEGKEGKEKEKEKNKDKKEDNKKKEGDKKKKIERHLDGGIILLREKCPFPW